MPVPRTRNGFTLLELLLVLAVIVMLSAMALPAIDAMYVDMKVQAGADHLRGQFAYARTLAIEQGQVVRFGVRSNTGEYRIAPDTSEFWSDGVQTAATEGSAQALESVMPSGIVFQFAPTASMSESDGWTTLVKFRPDGSCDADCTVVLELDDARPMELQIRALTGAVTTRLLKPEEAR